MEITLTPKQEAQLEYIAANTGRDAKEVAREVLAEALAERVRFIQSINRSRTSYARGEFLEEEEMDALIERDFDRHLRL